MDNLVFAETHSRTSSEPALEEIRLLWHFNFGGLKIDRERGELKIRTVISLHTIGLASRTGTH
jgi:hypothetical protein